MGPAAVGRTRVPHCWLPLAGRHREPGRVQEGRVRGQVVCRLLVVSHRGARLLALWAKLSSFPCQMYLK